MLLTPTAVASASLVTHPLRGKALECGSRGGRTAKPLVFRGGGGGYASPEARLPGTRNRCGFIGRVRDRGNRARGPASIGGAADSTHTHCTQEPTAWLRRVVRDDLPPPPRLCADDYVHQLGSQTSLSSRRPRDGCPVPLPTAVRADSHVPLLVPTLSIGLGLILVILEGASSTRRIPPTNERPASGPRSSP